LKLKTGGTGLGTDSVLFLFQSRYIICRRFGFRFCPGPAFGFGLGIALAVGMLRNFQAFQLAKKIHLACKRLLVSRQLRDQLVRASASIALNLAEGSGKRTGLDQRRFYSIALGSLRECEAILDLEEIENPELLRSIDHLGAILYTLTRDPAPPPTANRREGRYRTETETETATDDGQKTDSVPTTDSAPVLDCSPGHKKKPTLKEGGSC